MSDDAGPGGAAGKRSAPLSQSAVRVRDTADRRIQQAKAGVSGLLSRVRNGGAGQPHRDQRPDGSLVSPSPVVMKPSDTGGPLHVVVAPILGVRDAIRERWDDSIREARLAARDKESELRARYERQVMHDPRLHAEQHENRDKT